MKERSVDKNLIAACGLYCGGCKKFLMDKCPGCFKSQKVEWCQIRKCCIDNKYATCAECKDHIDVKECKHYKNPIAKFFSFIFGSDRPASIKYIRENGGDAYAKEMVERKKMCIKK